MANTVKPDDLSAAIARELEIYHQDVVKRVNQCSDEAVKALVKKTKATAPKRTGAFRRSIAGKRLEKGNRGDKFVWYVKAPHHRLTHLLVHGHEMPNGGRTAGDPFLADALAEVLPEYETKVMEAVKNG